MQIVSFKKNLYRLIGGRIREKRVELGYSQEKVAKAISMNRTSISNIEIGKHQVPLTKLYEITSFLECDIHLLLPTYAEVQEVIIESENSDFNKILEKEKMDRELKETIKNLQKNQ